MKTKLLWHNQKTVNPGKLGDKICMLPQSQERAKTDRNNSLETIIFPIFLSKWVYILRSKSGSNLHYRGKEGKEGREGEREN